MRVAVVVVNWNSSDDLSACLASLAAQSHRELDVIVVDNGSKDDSVARVRREHPDVLVLAEHENLGFAEGCNRGIAAAHTEWVAMLNNDAVADVHWARELVRAAEAAEPRCGMLQSLVLFQKEPAEINSTGVALFDDGITIDREFGRPLVGERTVPEEVFCVTAGACFYRRAMLDEIRLSSGWFDRGHFLYSEDTDLGWRARIAGWSAKLVPTSVVRHKFHGSSVRHPPRWLSALMHTNRARTLVKNASPGFLIRTLPKSVEHLATISWTQGPRGVARYVLAVADAVRLRREVSSMASVDRPALERRWAEPRSKR